MLRANCSIRILGGVLLAVTAIALTIRALTPDYAGVRIGRADAGYLESGDCRKCHESNYTTWHSTFHRTMTREADIQTVLGDFEHDNTLTYQGIRAEMVREGGRYWMKLTGADGKKQQLEIVRTVGSRRMQQYLTKSGDKWIRLPIAYDLVQRRWMHLNGSFFHADGGEYTSMSRNGIRIASSVITLKAQPGRDWEKNSWKTEVAELGIACGACHGPAGEHAQRALSPLTRVRWHLKDETAPSLAVTNPARLDSDRSAMVCGHCHGQRIPDPHGPYSHDPERR